MIMDLHNEYWDRVAEIIFSIPTILVGTATSCLPNCNSCLPKIQWIPKALLKSLGAGLFPILNFKLVHLTALDVHLPDTIGAKDVLYKTISH